MRATSALVVLGCGLVFGGCTRYHYYAKIVKPDSTGTPREVVASWNVTERALWMDASSEGFSVKVACSTAIMDFEEQPDGIVMRSDGSWAGAQGEGAEAVCGRAHNVKHVKDVELDESLTLELWCKPDVDDEMALPTPFLPPGTYVFPKVERTESEVDVAACQTTDATLAADQGQAR
jgi:hypothetical protein